MAQESDQIIRHIEEQREQLGEKIGELETRIRRAADWRARVADRPMLALAIAFGSGFLLASFAARNGDASAGE